MSKRTSQHILFFLASASWLQVGSRGIVIGGEVKISSGAKEWSQDAPCYWQEGDHSGELMEGIGRRVGLQ
jgi:hypothetical protein